MSDDVRTNEQGWIQAREANALRQQGQTTKAIESYDQVIATARRARDTRLLSQAYAGRGAVKIALGFYCARDPREEARAQDMRPEDDSITRGAIEDLELATHFDPNNGWAWAQLGEAHRSFGRDHFRLMPLRRFKEHVSESLRAFEKAGPLLPEQNAWLLAHEAAAHFLGLWRAYNIDTGLPDFSESKSDEDEREAREAKKHMERAEKGFKAAIKVNPNYAWAKRFFAYLLTVKGDYRKAQRLLSDALLDDPRAELHVLRSLSMLYRYAAQERDLRPRKRQRLLRLALRASQQTMERDSEDFFAVYAHAAVSVDMRVPDADAMCREARARILNQAVRGITMAFALHKQSGDTGEDFLSLLQTALGKAHRDPEIIAIAHHDPLWKGGPGQGGNGTLLQEIKKHLDNFLDDGQA